MKSTSVAFVSIDKRAYLAVDTSYERGLVALFTDDEIVFAQHLEEKFAHGKMLSFAIDAALKHEAHPTHLFCGLGPGSFVGVRISLATLLGFGFARDIPLMGFCSHEALAFSLDLSSDFSIYMKASGDLGYLTHYRHGAEGIQEIAPTSVVAIQAVRDLVNANAIIVTDSIERLRNFTPEHLRLHAIAGPTPLGIKRAAYARMKRMQGFADESVSIKPNYVKPPNVSMPKTKLVIDNAFLSNAL